MRCNLLGWLLGLPVLALVWGLAVKGERGHIVDDLQQRTTAALEKAELGWAKIKFDATDGEIYGAAYSEHERSKALKVAQRTWGAWSVKDSTSLIEKAPNYVWGAAIDQEHVQLTGYVPNEKARRQILEVAKQSFPRHSVRDNMQPARGAPGEDVWIDGVSFGLRQLTQLKQGGRVDLHGTKLGVSGEAESVTAYRTIKGDFSRRLPSGILLAKDEVSPPRVAPFTWRATFKSNQVEISGHVPPGKVRDALAEIAAEAFPKAAIVYKITAASGAPDEWLKAVSIVLRNMSKLEGAAAAIEDRRVTFEGLAVQEVTSERVAADLKVGMPDKYELQHKISFTQPTLPIVQPFTTTMTSDGEKLSLTGYAPDERGRQRLVATAKKYFPKREVVDALTYANGAPAGWLTCADAGILGLSKLDSGRAELADTMLRLSGDTRDETIAAGLPAEVRAVANRSCKDMIEIKLKAPPEPDLKWQALSIEKRVELNGEVIDSDVKEAVLSEAKRLFPDRQIIDNMRINPGRSGKWSKVVLLGLGQLAQLRSGLAQLDGQVLTLNGIAADTAVATRVKSRIERGIISGYSGQAIIEVKSDAMIWSEQEAKRKSEAATEEERRRKEEEAKRAASLQEVQRRAAEAAAKARAAAEERERQEELERRKAAEEARKQAEEAERQRAAEVERQLRAEMEERRRAEAERLRQAEALLRAQAEAEARRKAEAQARALAQRSAEEDARRRAEEAARSAAAEAVARQGTEEARKDLEVATKCKEELNRTVENGIIRFEFGSDRLNPDSTATLDRLIETYRKCPGAKLEIGGHTDSIGSERANLELSKSRAEAVLDYFVRRGLPRDKFVARGFGESQPREPNTSSDNRARNRRIEFGVIAN